MEKNSLKSMQVIRKIESSLLNKGYMKNNREFTGDGNVLKLKKRNKGRTFFKVRLGVLDANGLTRTFVLDGLSTENDITIVLRLNQPHKLNHKQVDIMHNFSSFFKRQGIDGRLTVDSDKWRVLITTDLTVAYNECDEKLLEGLIPAMIENMKSYHSLNQEWTKNTILLD